MTKKNDTLADGKTESAKVQGQRAEDMRNDADSTNDQVAGDGDVSRTEHSMGSRQPDDGSFDDVREQPPLEGRDVPQKIVTAENDTPTPGEG